MKISTGNADIRMKKLELLKFVWKAVKLAFKSELMKEEDLVVGVMSCCYLIVPLQDTDPEVRDQIIAEIVKNLKSKGSRLF